MELLHHVKETLSHYPILRSDSIDQTIRCISTKLWPHRMRLLENGSNAQSRLDGFEAGAVGVFYINYGKTVEVDAGPIREYYLVQTTLAGGGEVCNGDRRTLATAGATVVLSPSGATRTSSSHDCERLIVRIKREAVERCLASQLNYPIHKPVVFDLRLSDDGGIAHAWLNAVAYFCSQHSALPEVSRARLMPHLVNGLIASLLALHSSNWSDCALGETHTAVPYHVRRAREYIHAHLNESLTLATLAHGTGVSARTLQGNFKRFLSQTPGEYVRAVRLRKVDLALRNVQDHRTLSQIMLDCGVAHFSRFAASYRDTYGMLPSQVRQACREGAAG